MPTKTSDYPAMTPTARLPRILLIDDDAVTRELVTFCLEKTGYRVMQATSGHAGIHAALAERPALIVLDWMMPEMSGLDALAELRRLGCRASVLMLTSRTEVSDRVKGLRQGADDYLLKPFSQEELLARVDALLRREARVSARRRRLRFDEIVVDVEARTAQAGGAPLALSRTEFSILELFASHAGRVVSRDLMLDVVWGYTRFPSSRTVDTHIWRLRKKLNDCGENPRWIHRVQGSGYMLSADAVVEDEAASRGEPADATLRE